MMDSESPEGAALKERVRTFMDKLMPSHPLGLLDTSSESCWDRWHFETRDWYSIDRYTIAGAECPECGSFYADHQHHGQEHEECENCWDEDDQSPKLERKTLYGYVLVNDYTGDHYGWPDKGPTNLNGEEFEWHPMFWRSRSDAEDAIKELNDWYESEHGHEHSYGFPWANNWFFRPDAGIRTEDLVAAGFRVATYAGGEGRWHDDEHYRLCGVDGGGYSFDGHFASLFLRYRRRLGSRLELVVNGSYVTYEIVVDADLIKSTVDRIREIEHDRRAGK
jgi:ribosomal protein S27AE